MVDKPAPDPAFEALLDYIQEGRGFDFRGYKRNSLRRRIAIRMQAVGAEDFPAYQTHLEVHPGEFADLLNTVLINVTSFFRDADAWEALRTQVIPKLIDDQDAAPIRIWSIGCASGQEPYSIAMLFAEALGVPSFSERVKIYATDLDEEALRAARAATYLPRDVEDVPAELLEKYFERTTNHYVFNRELRKCVIFGQHDVVRDAPISRIDLLVCRNLLIYLEAETQDVVLPRLHYALTPEGYLFLGKAETQLARSPLFQPVEMKHRIFTKVAQKWRRANGGNLATPSDFRGGEIGSGNARLMETVLNEAPAAYLVVDENGSITLANPAARSLLGVGEGDIGRPFHDLPISYRPTELRTPIEGVLRDRRGIRLEHQELHQSPGETSRLTIEMRPLLRADGTAFAVLLVFSDTTRLYAIQCELETAQQNLESTIEELQSANEELETTNEELQSTNEELETTNEELQSTNEELETINEEARSSNEEMESANEELRLHADQAATYRGYLDSVMRGLDMGIVVIDEHHVVQSWNRWSENAWGLRAEEAVGTGFDQLDIGLPTLMLRDNLLLVQSGHRQQAEQVLEGIDRRGRAILCRIRISGLYRDAREPSGVVLAFEDITDERRKEDYIRYLGRIMGLALNEIYFLDPETMRFVLANDGAEVKLQCTQQQLKQLTLADFIPGEDVDSLKHKFGVLMDGSKPEIVFETMIRTMDGSEHPAEMCMQYFGDETPPILVALVHDTSERKQLAAE